MPDQSGQADGAEIHQRHAEAPAIDAERRVPGGDAQVAPQCQFEASGDRVALDRRDDRFAQFEACWSHGCVAAFDTVAAPAGGGFLEVEAGAEGAVRASEDRDTQSGVGIETAKRVSECARGWGIDRVAGGGPVDGYD